jgi:carboxymethylenebutenolidase
MLVSLTHDFEIDWMLPGVSPTGKYVEVPTVAIVNSRGDKLSHEHIYWDRRACWCRSACSIGRGYR